MAFNVNGDISVASHKFKWVINDFSTSCRHVGEALHSPPFFGMKDIQCTLKLYPKGENEESRDLFSLVLSVHAKIEGTVILQILNNKGEAMVSHIAEGRAFINGSYLYEYKKYGLRDFIIDPANDILNDDKMTIACKITKLSPKEMKKRSDKNKNHEEMWQGVVGRLEEIDKYECLINENKFSDVTLISEGRALKVHKCILAKSSLVFAAMFEAEMLEKQDSSVEIEDIS
ncbi:speckle-type POZ protein B-like isoform X2 [Nasonia vitripennis]|uniref:BTB domain-containing protein n=1 Tax=Nasonia vitripennis TaxID=7425 RepID=A0A7M7HBX7_NASVI|nr:speckle-type POZ protein B-like isoform X2 [Nasonia vitripennis]